MNMSRCVLAQGLGTTLSEDIHGGAIKLQNKSQGCHFGPPSEACCFLLCFISSFHKLLLTEKHYKKGIKREKSWWRNAFLLG